MLIIRFADRVAQLSGWLIVAGLMIGGDVGLIPITIGAGFFAPAILCAMMFRTVVYFYEYDWGALT